ncbi:MAG: hypothetical protein ACJ79H_16720 [Myxococcales bacterium]
MAATLLACIGAGLLAGAPDWVTRVALAKAAPAISATAEQAQGSKNATNDGVATATASVRLRLERFEASRTCRRASRFDEASDLEGAGARDATRPSDDGERSGVTGWDPGTRTVDESTADVRRSPYDVATVENRTLDGRADAFR